MKKSIIFLILTLAIISLSAVAAGDNITDADADEGDVLDSNPVQNITPVAEDVKSDSMIVAKNTTGYEKFSTNITVTLTSNGTALASKNVIFNINGNNYTRLSDESGQASLSIKLAKGTYPVKFFFLGDNSTNPCQASALVNIKSPTKTVLKIADKNINYRQGSKSVFIVRLVSDAGRAVSNQQVKFKANGKTYTSVTDKKGYARIFLSLKKGTYKVSYSFSSKSPYLSSSGSYKIKVKSPISKGNGYWMWANGIKKVNLKTLKQKGTKHIFLHSYAFDVHGKKAVKSWISKVNKYGMKVHIWIQAFYNGKWVKPIKSDGSIDSAMIKKISAKAVYYSKISGVSGVHLDYARFGGTAMKYENSVKAVNYLVKKVCSDVRKVRPNCIISSSVMPEPGMTEYYYGQEIPTMTRYLDVIVPMAYKGNYGKTTEWLNYVTKAFVLDSNGAQVWTGLQAYKSDDDVTKLSQAQLIKDAKACMNAGAKGVVLFRIGITKLLNFNKV